MDPRRAARGASVLLAGALGGAIAVLLIERFGGDAKAKRPPDSSPAQRETNSSFKPNGPSVRALHREQRELEARLAMLEERATSDTPDAQDPEGAPAAGEPPTAEQLERHTEQIRARHAAWRETHSREARDEWSPHQETTFTTALREVSAAGGFAVVNVDCRTTWCRAELEWRSYGAAQKGFQRALHVTVPGCESAILLETPADPSRPYRASAMYNCEAARAGDSE